MEPISAGRRFLNALGRLPAAARSRISQLFPRRTVAVVEQQRPRSFSATKERVEKVERVSLMPLSWQDADMLRRLVDESFSGSQLQLQLHFAISNAESSNQEPQNLNGRELAIFLKNHENFNLLKNFFERHGDIPTHLIQDFEHSALLEAINHLKNKSEW